MSITTHLLFRPKGIRVLHIPQCYLLQIHCIILQLYHYSLPTLLLFPAPVNAYRTQETTENKVSIGATWEETVRDFLGAL